MATDKPIEAARIGISTGAVARAETACHVPSRHAQARNLNRRR